MKCPNCRNEVNENSKFCTRCGYDLKNGNANNLQKSNKKIIIAVLAGIAVVLIVVIAAGTYVLLNERSGDNSLYETDTGWFNFLKETTTEETTEITEETTTEETTETTEETTAEFIKEAETNTPGSTENDEMQIQDLVKIYMDTAG